MIQKRATRYIGPLTDKTSVRLNQWPCDGIHFLCPHFFFSCNDTLELLPNWIPTMESFILENTVRFITLQINVLLIICLRSAGKELLSLIALSLSLR